MTSVDVESLDDDAVITRSVTVPETFAVLFDRHAQEIHRYLARRLGPDTAEDLVAETFLAAFRQRDRYEASRRDARPWLYGIATNLIRRQRRQEVRFWGAIARSGHDPAVAGPATEDVEERVTAQAIRLALARGLSRLSAPDREALLLIAASGFSYAEAAQALGIPAGTVSSRVARARRQLRTELGGIDPREDAGDGTE